MAFKGSTPASNQVSSRWSLNGATRVIPLPKTVVVEDIAFGAGGSEFDSRTG